MNHIFICAIHEFCSVLYTCEQLWLVLLLCGGGLSPLTLYSVESNHSGHSIICIFSYICATRWAIIQLSKVFHPFRFHGFGVFGFVHAPLSPLYPVLMQISTGNQDRGFLCSEGFVFTTASINRLLAKNNKLVFDRFLIRNWPLVLLNTLERPVLDRLEQQPGITDFVDDMYRGIL
jgi:hypothetical protein